MSRQTVIGRDGSPEIPSRGRACAPIRLALGLANGRPLSCIPCFARALERGRGKAGPSGAVTGPSFPTGCSPHCGEAFFHSCLCCDENILRVENSDDNIRVSVVLSARPQMEHSDWKPSKRRPESLLRRMNPPDTKIKSRQQEAALKNAPCGRVSK